MKIILFLCVCFVGCTSNKPAAPMNLPRPTFKPTTDKLERDINSLEKSIDSASSRLDKIRILLDEIDSSN